ncbi:MAG: DoxX family protein [Bacteroidales bacterium]|nr:DoxX family protein [Bacteroidales bacterium]
MKALTFLVRILMGAVFAFSGFTKAVDPYGVSYKINDYFIAFGWLDMDSFALPSAFLLSALELTVGIMLLLNLRARFATFLALGLELIFTPITLWLAITNAVSDCGCFGDFIKLTNWQTFWKNVIFLVMIIFLIFRSKTFHNPLSDNVELGISAAIYVFAILFQTYMVRHLPIFDWRPYKVGNNIAQLMEVPDDAEKDSVVTLVTYQNTVTGEIKDFTMCMIPSSDDTTWVWKDTKTEVVKEGFRPDIHDFVVRDTSGFDYADTLLKMDQPILLVVAYDLYRSNEEGLNTLRYVQDYALENNYLIIGYTASDQAKVEQIKTDYSIDFPFFFGDGTAQKTIIRANPGIVKLEKGTVTGKWNWRDFKTK